MLSNYYISLVAAFNPTIQKDGDMYLCYSGINIPDGTVGTGKSAIKAVEDWAKALGEDLPDAHSEGN